MWAIVSSSYDLFLNDDLDYRFFGIRKAIFRKGYIAVFKHGKPRGEIFPFSVFDENAPASPPGLTILPKTERLSLAQIDAFMAQTESMTKPDKVTTMKRAACRLAQFHFAQLTKK